MNDQQSAINNDSKITITQIKNALFRHESLQFLEPVDDHLHFLSSGAGIVELLWLYNTYEVLTVWHDVKRPRPTDPGGDDPEPTLQRNGHTKFDAPFRGDTRRGEPYP
jgi:hypothetical protein